MMPRLLSAPPPQLFLVALAALAALLLASGCERRGDLPSLDEFEGEVIVAASGSFNRGAPAGKRSISVAVRGDKLRFESPSEASSGNPASAGGGAGYYLIDGPGKKLFVVNEPRKQAIVFELKPKASGGPGTSPPQAAVTHTGRKSTVSGFSCEEWDAVEADKSRATICVASKTATFLNIPIAAGLSATRTWMSQVFDGKHFPLRYVTYNAEGVETGRLELTKLERIDEDPSQLEVPSGYTTVDLAALLQSGGLPPAHPKE